MHGQLMIEPTYDLLCKPSKEAFNIVEDFVGADDFFPLGVVETYKNRKRGMMSVEGKTIAEAIYDDVGGFQPGVNLARITTNDHHGFIDTSGKIIVPPIFDSYQYYHAGTVEVIRNGKCHYYNDKGCVFNCPN
jgi:hypothetical protein